MHEFWIKAACIKRRFSVGMMCDGASGHSDREEKEENFQEGRDKHWSSSNEQWTHSIIKYQNPMWIYNAPSATTLSGGGRTNVGPNTVARACNVILLESLKRGTLTRCLSMAWAVDLFGSGSIWNNSSITWRFRSGEVISIAEWQFFVC